MVGFVVLVFVVYFGGWVFELLWKERDFADTNLAGWLLVLLQFLFTGLASVWYIRRSSKFERIMTEIVKAHTGEKA